MTKFKKLNYDELIKKIMLKKEFSQLPKKDVELIYLQVHKKNLIQEEEIKETRNILRRMYTAFVSSKLLNARKKNFEWFLKKHISTKERFGEYKKVYSRILQNYSKGVNIYDLGSGVNGFSYDFFPVPVNYFGFEAVGQLVDLQNNYFIQEKKKAKCVQGSLFDLEELIKFLKKGSGKKIIFLFKTLDSLEMLKRNYSKDLLNEIVPLADKVVISFAMKSLVSKKSFHANRKWLTDFIFKNFVVLDEFESGIEKYVVFCKK